MLLLLLLLLLQLQLLLLGLVEDFEAVEGGVARKAEANG